VFFGSASVRSFTRSGSTCDNRGDGKLKSGKWVSFRIVAVDNSDSGRRDTFAIQISNGYSAAGTRGRGDIETH
jgi:hypothetical protein